MASPDWGLDNVAAHAVREHACLRFRRALADRFGLRALMAPTTPISRVPRRARRADPLAPRRRSGGGDRGGGARPVRRLAAGARRSSGARRRRRRLAATARASARLRLGPAGETCGSCAWLYVGGRGRARWRAAGRRPARSATARGRSATARACARWEPPVDCQACGACCREAYHSVTVSVRDPVVWQEPDLIVRHGHRFEIRRARGPALRGARTSRRPARPRATPARSTRTGRGPAASSRPTGGTAWTRAGASASARGRRASGRAPDRCAETIDLFVPLAELDAPLRAARGAGARMAARRAWASCASCGARSTRARGGRSASGCASLVARRGEALATRRRPAARAALAGGSAAAAGRGRRLGPGGLVGGAAARRGRRARDHRSSRASRCSRAGAIWRSSRAASLTPSSNYCFGEGGAGTYSDGKLYTRAKDRGGVAEVIADLVRFGAPDEIAVESRPHVGSNRLPRVLAALRDHLATLGVEHRFEASVAGLRTDARARARGAPRRRRRAAGRRRRAGGRALGARRLRLGGRGRRRASSASRSRSACASSTRSG